MKIVKQEDELDVGVLDTSVAINKAIIEEDVVINGNWNAAFDISTEISQSKTKAIKIDKSLQLDFKGTKSESIISELVVSPLRIIKIGWEWDKTNRFYPIIVYFSKFNYWY